MIFFDKNQINMVAYMDRRKIPASFFFSETWQSICIPKYSKHGKYAKSKEVKQGRKRVGAFRQIGFYFFEQFTKEGKRCLGNSEKNRKGFTLIELMIVYCHHRHSGSDCHSQFAAYRQRGFKRRGRVRPEKRGHSPGSHVRG